MALKRTAVAALCLAAALAPAAAQAPSPYSGDVTNATAQPSNLARRTVGSRIQDRISVADLPGVTCSGTTDDSAALASGLAGYVNTGAQIVVPNGCRLLMAGGGQVRLQGFSLVGPTGRDDGEGSSSGYGQQGGTFLITDTAKPPFVTGSEWTLQNLIFFWPNQTEAQIESNGGPIVYKPLLQADGSASHQDWAFDHNQVVNAYDIIDLSGSPSNVGHFYWTHNQEFALHYHIVVDQVGGESWIQDNQASLIGFFFQAGSNGGNTSLRNFAAANAEFVRITGSGTQGQSPTTSVDGMHIDDNYVFLAHYGVHVSGGQLNISSIDFDGIDGTPVGFGVDNNGTALSVSINGGVWLCTDGTTNQSLSPLPALYIYANPNGGTHTGGSTGLPSGVNVSNLNITSSLAHGVAVNDSLGGSFSYTGGRIDNVGTRATSSTGYDGILYSAAGQLTVSGVALSTAAAGNPAGQGVVDNGASVASVVGDTFVGFNIPVVLNSTAGKHTVVGNTSVGTSTAASNSAINGPGGSTAITAGNNWDVGPQVTHVYAPNGQTDQINCDGAAAVIGCQLIAKGTGVHRLFTGGGANQVLAVGGDGTSSNASSAEIKAGANTYFSSTAGNTNLTADNGNVAITKLLPCGSAPSGYVCSQGAGAAVIVHP